MATQPAQHELHERVGSDLGRSEEVLETPRSYQGGGRGVLASDHSGVHEPVKRQLVHAPQDL